LTQIGTGKRPSSDEGSLATIRLPGTDLARFPEARFWPINKLDIHKAFLVTYSPRDGVGDNGRGQHMPALLFSNLSQSRIKIGYNAHRTHPTQHQPQQL
jgi:hypothetical protein